MDRPPRSVSLACRVGAVCAIALAFGIPPVHGVDSEPPKPAGWRIHRSPPPENAKTHTVVPGGRFGAGWLKRWFLGSDYRDLWTTPIEVSVLDLEAVGGGLIPLRAGGFGQSIALHFTGADSQRYTVRSLDKDPTKRIWDELKGTVVDDVLQDLISALLPAGALVCDPLMDATGILHAPHTLVVIPDDPRLGRYRQEFAGLIGTLQQVPSEGPDNTPGFAGSRQISGSESLWEKVEKSPRNRVDGRAYLNARLMDFLLNDKDRHRGQWRWARFPAGDNYRWVPIPEDRDQAFVSLDGFSMAVARMAVPSQIKFEDSYPNVVGLTRTGWELDRELLVGLEKTAWDSTVAELQSDLPDSVIEDAVRRLPAPYHELIGARLGKALRSRRDRLPDFVDRYYRLITREAEIIATDEDEYAELEHKQNGDLSARIGLLSKSRNKEPAYFQRTFHPRETKEVRLYLSGGEDRVEVLGEKARILVRIDGGGGDDTFVNSSLAGAGKTRFYDHRGENRFEKGQGAKVDRRPFERPPGSTTGNTKYALDWGKKAITLPIVDVSPDLGIYVGILSSRQRFGWRKVPFASRHKISLGLASEGPQPFAAYTGTFRHIVPDIDGSLHLEYSGIEVIRYHGLGNETASPGGTSYYKVEQKTFVLAPALEVALGKNRASGEEHATESLRPTFSASMGPVLKYSDTPAGDNEGRYIRSFPEPLYGTGSFGQIGAQGAIGYDTRDKAGFPRSGAFANATAAIYPKAWDVEETFGAVSGAASVYLTAPIPTRPTLALRAGGQKVWGDYPFHEAAYIGGSKTLRGYRENRFAGDASSFGNAELRFGLFPLKILVPGELGLFAAADAGRVYLHEDPDDADKWHTGLGGGVWLSFLQGMQTLSVAIIDGDDLTGVYLRAGFVY